MSDQRLYLDVDRATAGSRALHEAGEQLAALHRGPATELATASAGVPWGRDGFGRSFEEHYRPAEQQVLDAVAKLAAYVSGLGEAAGLSVRDNIGADLDAHRRLRGRT